jgi:spermidine synthase
MVLVFGARTVLRWLVARSALSASVREAYTRHDWVTYLPLLIFTLGAFGVRFPLATSGVVLGLVFILLQGWLISWLAPPESRSLAFVSIQWLSCLFFLSGFAALIYQIAWQRALFATYGINIESVTIIVSLFMFGLGIGSLVGGLLSRCFPRHAPQLFLVCEAGTGLFGLISMPLIERVGAATLHGSLVSVSLATYALLSLPTILMGATLPILVAHLNRHYENVGKSVGVLYFINTMGSAVACLITADILFVFLGQRAAVIIAAFCNLLVAVLVYQFTRNARNSKAGSYLQPQEEVSGPPIHKAHRLSLVLILAAATGYISLSQEIIWFRVISYITGGSPQVFARLLTSVLLGIALGALLAKRVCASGRERTMPYIAGALSLAGLCYYFSVPLVARLLTHSAALGENACYFAVTLVALLVGSTFPVLCHHAIKTKNSAGLWLSWLYFANILGATAGPLITGFALLETFSLEQNILFVSAGSVALGGVVWALSSRADAPRASIGILAAGAVVVLVFVHDGLYSNTLERLHFKTNYVTEQPYKYLVQNRSGIVAVKAAHPDRVCGGGCYDGEINLSPRVGQVGVANHIRQAYWFAALHPEPMDVLVIGLASGSWARIVADHHAVKRCTVVEVNAGYADLIRHYPEVSTLLEDPKVTICIDDARRWLRRNPSAKFDFIVMDTTQHYRDHVTNILSCEFMSLCRAALKPDGVFYLNTTGSEDVAFTAATVFKYITRSGAFVGASDSPFAMNVEQRRKNLQRFYRNGVAVFDEDSSTMRAILEELAAREMKDEGPELRSMMDRWCITDDNMATEFKNNNRWFDPQGQWGRNVPVVRLLFP